MYFCYMTQYEYEELSTSEQVIALLHGEIISRCIHNGLSYYLFYINNFFIEVEMDRERKQILDIIPFTNGEHFDKYLDRIDMAKLMGKY